MMESNAFTEVRPTEAEAAKLAEHAKSQTPSTVTPLRTILMPYSVSEAHVLIATGQAYLESVGYTGPSPTKVSITLPESQVKFTTHQADTVSYKGKYIDLCKAIESYLGEVGWDSSADGYDFISTAIRTMPKGDV